ncbi:MAG: hypothetical protein WBG92_15755 [Thiohalocapsa sp.]
MSQLPAVPQNAMPEAPIQWRSIPALAERINAGAKHPTLSSHAIRHYVRRANENGLAPHIRRLGRKLLVNEAGFIDWLGQQGADANG